MYLKGPVVCLDTTHVLLSLGLRLIVVVDVVTDRLIEAEVDLAGLLQVESLGGNTYQSQVHTKKQENWFQRYLSIRAKNSLYLIHYCQNKECLRQ